MIASLQLIFIRLLEETPTTHYRFLYNSIDLNNRLIGLVGARGVGKTTLLLQLIKNQFKDLSNIFYFSADHIYFEQVTLYQFIEELYLTEGKSIFFIDEIHKYKNWNQELKNLYDGFPKLRLIFSGSSSLDLIKGSYDLSRRAILYHLPGLSFREYYNFNTKENFAPYTLDDLITEHQSLNSSLAILPKIKGYFKEYLAKGFYPFYFENPLTYYERILTIIEKTIYEDIASFYNLKTNNLHLFKKILIFLTSIPPGQLSTHNIAKNLSMDDKTIIHYLNILESTGLITLIYPAAIGNQLLRRPEKIFLNNTNLYHALVTELSSGFEIGTVRELFFIQSIKNANLNIFHNTAGDFKVGKHIFEIGGKNKTRKQVKGLENSFLIKDDTIVAKTGEIPLFFFGFLY